MARIALTCSCGWNFFLPGSTPGHEVSCPSCTRSVPIPGRKPGMDPSEVPASIAARLQRRATALRLLVGLIIVGAAGATYFSWKHAPPAQDVSKTSEGPPRAPAAAPRTGGPAAPRINPPPPARIAMLRRRLLETVWELNMASIVSECLRFRNLAREWAALQSTVGSREARLKADLAELAAANEKIALEPYFAPGDRIVAFGQRDLTTMKRVDAAQTLHAWMNAWRPGPALHQLEIERDEKRLTLYLQFPEDTRDLLLLLRHPYLQLPPEPDRGPAAVPAISDPGAVEQAVETIAAELTARTQQFDEIIEEMRRRTESMTTSAVPIWPDPSVRGIAFIENPLTFKPSQLTAGASREIAAWWEALPREDRKQFAVFFGLWCANARVRASQK